MDAITKAISLKGTMTSTVLAVAGRQRLGGLVSGALLLFAMACCGLAPVDAVASNVKFVGNAAYTYAGNVAVLTADEIRNFDSSGASGPLQLELWAIAGPFGGGPVTGYKLAEYTLGQLGPGFSYSNVSSGSVPFTPPPPRRLDLHHRRHGIHGRSPGGRWMSFRQQRENRKLHVHFVHARFGLPQALATRHPHAPARRR